ncbi:MAG: LPS export ABC transporter permease LptF [Alphaproteobacteria bacterium]|nr:LPS export ABC transporter permease LptF [Alphaproteobacteria bacterium]MCK5555946.1 LPS export ABC transporter permease LptF [Alphaproteobacteria bacterium]MCK5658924.1 LPS export ABC transporter permease LptF [Alphaproteobacteria bacterium]
MTRYLFKNLLNATIFVAVTLTIVVLLTQSLKLLELVANSGAPLGLFLQLVALTIPKFLEIILPLSLVVAVLFTYNRLIMDNELTVMRASGVDQYTLARPAIILAVIISLLLTIVTTWISPECYGHAKELRRTIKTQYSAFLLREGIFNTFSDKFTVYLRSRENNGDMSGLMIYDTRDKTKPPIAIIAKKGRIVMDDDLPTIVVFDGIRQQLDPGSGAISKLHFSRYTIEIRGLEGIAREHWRGARERTLGELLNPDPNSERDKASHDLFLSEANHRIITPWNSLGFTMIALVTLLLGPFNRRGQNAKVLAAMILIIIVQTLNLSLVNFSKKYIGAVPFIYLNTLLPIVLGFLFLHNIGEQKLKSILHRWNALSIRNKGGQSV